jgi:hypothetical protein
MRTTLTIDDDLLESLKREAARRKRPFKEIVNETLRRGLEAPVAPRSSYVLPVLDLGHPPKLDIDHSLRLAEALEDEEVQRKMSVRK